MFQMTLKNITKSQTSLHLAKQIYSSNFYSRLFNFDADFVSK